MLTNNGKAYLLPTKIMASEGYPAIRVKLGSGVAVTKNGSEINGIPHVYLGTGSTPASADDYTMNRITTLTLVNEEATEGTSTGRSYEDRQISAYTATYRNDTDDTITVAEVGVAIRFGGLSYENEYALLSRDVINPVAIAPGKTYAFSVVWG